MVNSRKVNARILELGLTQESVAKSMGIDRSTLNNKINNKVRFFADEVGMLCNILNITTRTELKSFFGIDFLTISESCENDTN